ncbi:MAG: AAA family ATPase [Candidatus Woesearchaeota archaeon]
MNKTNSKNKNKTDNKDNTPNRIILFGFSGSGKSTIANLISEKYNLRVIHPSGIIRDLYEKKEININHTRYNEGFWESSEGIKLFKSRLYEKEPLDIIADKILVEEITKGNVVIDSWNLPWLTTIGKRIYLKADLEIRSQRVAKRSNITYNNAINIVSMKDTETTKLFKRLYGFDIAQDHNVFDYVINTNKMTKMEVFDKICNYLNR